MIAMVCLNCYKADSIFDKIPSKIIKWFHFFI